MIAAPRSGAACRELARGTCLAWKLDHDHAAVSDALDRLLFRFLDIAQHAPRPRKLLARRHAVLWSHTHRGRLGREIALELACNEETANGFGQIRCRRTLSQYDDVARVGVRPALHDKGLVGEWKVVSEHDSRGNAVELVLWLGGLCRCVSA